MMEYLSLNPPLANQEHWKPLYHLCHPCSIQYDYIGNFDDLYKDSIDILKNVLTQEQIYFPATVPSKTPKYVDRYLSTVTSDILMKVRTKFRLDFDLFGYH